MKATGIVRRIDDLGRVVIPKEIRRTMRIREGDPLEIYTTRDGEVIFKKYSLISGLEDFAAQSGYKMLLVHYPEYYAEDTGALIGKDIDMALCGHAHGGQVRLPFLGALYTPDQGFLPTLTAGLHQIGDTSLIISRGLGDGKGTPVPRINNPPELVIVDINWF